MLSSQYVNMEGPSEVRERGRGGERGGSLQVDQVLSTSLFPLSRSLSSFMCRYLSLSLSLCLTLSITPIHHSSFSSTSASTLPLYTSTSPPSLSSLPSTFDPHMSSSSYQICLYPHHNLQLRPLRSLFLRLSFPVFSFCYNCVH